MIRSLVNRFKSLKTNDYEDTNHTNRTIHLHGAIRSRSGLHRGSRRDRYKRDGEPYLCRYQSIEHNHGHGLDADLMAASRFLFQAGLGGSMEDIERLTLSGDYEAWIDEQAAMPMTDVLSNVIAINEEEFQYFITQTDAEGNPNRPENYFGPWFKHFSYAWWDNVAKAPDQLRYKVANALSQLFVVSHNNTDLGNHGEAMGAYYDLLLRRSFGNFRDLLGDVTFSPSMGCLLYTSPSPRDRQKSRMPSSA